MTDRYTKAVLTVIAGALIYLCVVMTAFPALSAQTAKRPGDPTGPGEMVIVGWKSDAAIPIVTKEPLRVITERSSGVPDRVVLVGWEELSQRDRQAQLRRFDSQSLGLPVVVRAK
jgi:hypothetical protein